MGEPAALPAAAAARPAAGRRRLLRPSWLRRPQLRTRVLAGVVAVTLLALAVFDVAAAGALRTYLLGHTDARLQTVLSLYRPGWVPGPPVSSFRGKVTAGPGRLEITGPKARLPGPLSGVGVQFRPVRGPAKTFVKGGPGLPAALSAKIKAAVAHGGQVTISPAGVEPLRVSGVAFPGPGGGILLAATSLGDVNGTLSQLELILVVGSLAAALFVALGVALIMRRGLRPIEVMAGEADRITAGDLADRVSAQDPGSEVGRLGAALNGMLARIEAALAEREASQELTRRFFADASHELRNPLASLRANAELYQQGALQDRSQVDEAMRRISLEAQRMSGLVDDMLRLARLDQHPCQEYEAVDVTSLAEECADRARAADPQRGWQARIAPGLVVAGDEELLRRAIDNLLANVRAHTPAGSGAALTAARRGPEVTITVSDDGPGVPPGEVGRIFDRFYRGEAPSRAPGSGLGLAIVAAVATAHRGSVTAALNQPHGLRVTLAVPARLAAWSPPPQQETGRPALA